MFASCLLFERVSQAAADLMKLKYDSREQFAVDCGNGESWCVAHNRIKGRGKSKRENRERYTEVEEKTMSEQKREAQLTNCQR